MCRMWRRHVRTREPDAKERILIEAGLMVGLDMTFIAKVLKGNDDDYSRNVKAVQQQRLHD